MAYQVMWYKTSLPKDVVDIFLKEEKEFKRNLEKGLVSGDDNPNISIRNSDCSWISSKHWMAGLCYHYILKANEENFRYDIGSFGNREIQYTSYTEGQYYKWHVDTSLAIQEEDTDRVRKLSFSLQLSDPEEYSGGELQLLSDDNFSYFAPKTKGSIIIFDSRMRHRVRKVNSGCRKSLVGWVEGPVWR
tara:strand:+ start:7066 stop:7632 length:567 start_codon:yes stop_codon:yes gene_type:complete